MFTRKYKTPALGSEASHVASSLSTSSYGTKNGGFSLEGPAAGPRYGEHQAGLLLETPCFFYLRCQMSHQEILLYKPHDTCFTKLVLGVQSVSESITEAWLCPGNSWLDPGLSPISLAFPADEKSEDQRGQGISFLRSSTTRHGGSSHWACVECVV